ncbi:hypothetical protein [Rhodococcoides kyotonense]|uniref:Uncharacterized protein n=1 Tax=Rhodococcoides kyotonense TaxID=398843 RepID=A0A239FSG5_9NOCA|nr:hypothetical protein [Rhodococcus kyotonensis]SNS59548.1 hypothetical protein SAMN05421642_103425 [Rhodococcus kyotonensis]
MPTFEVSITLKFDLDADTEHDALLAAEKYADAVDVCTALERDADEVDVDATVERYDRPGADAGDHWAAVFSDEAVGL